MVNAIIGDAALVDRWQELGHELGLDYTDIVLIRNQFRPEEHIQRMVERWFEREDVCTWEAFNAAKSKVSTRQLQPLRTDMLHSPTTQDTESRKLLFHITTCIKSSYFLSDVQVMFDGFEKRFRHLQVEARKELEHKEVLVETVVDEEFITMPNSINKMKKYERFIKKIVKRIEKQAPKQLDMKEFFKYLNRNCWNFFEYHLLEYFINCRCSYDLQAEMRAYVTDMKTFQKSITISEFIEHGQQAHLIEMPDDPDTELNIPENFRRVATRHCINPDTFTLDKLEKFRYSLCSLKLDLSECALRVYHIKRGSVVIEWLVTEEFIEKITAFLSDEDGFDFLWTNDIESITINGKTLYTVRFLLSFHTFNISLFCADVEHTIGHI